MTGSADGDPGGAAEGPHECGFPARPCPPPDLLGTLRAFTGMWRWTMAGLDDAALAAPGPGGGPSVLHHVDAARATIEGASDRARALVDDPSRRGAVSSDPVRPAGASRTARAAVAALDRAVAGLNAVAGRADAALWAADAGGAPGALATIVAGAVHDGVHRLHEGGRAVHDRGGGAPARQSRSWRSAPGRSGHALPFGRAQVGCVEQLNASGGGVPKLPVLTGRIDEGGLVGDRQAERRIHGRPYQAVSLWSAEVIDALRAEGHGVYPGAAGENVTLSGVDWAAVRPGVRIRLGEALVEVSAFATPCAKNVRWFVDGAIDRIDHRRNPGWSRAYAWVLRPGDVRPGDPAVVEPPPVP